MDLGGVCIGVVSLNVETISHENLCKGRGIYGEIRINFKNS